MLKTREQFWVECDQCGARAGGPFELQNAAEECAYAAGWKKNGMKRWFCPRCQAPDVAYVRHEPAPRDMLTAPCPACTEARELLKRVEGLAQNPVSDDDPLKFSGAQLDCAPCGNRGRVLTDAGRELLAFVRDWQLPAAAEKEELEF